MKKIDSGKNQFFDTYRFFYTKTIFNVIVEHIETKIKDCTKYDFSHEKSNFMVCPTCFLTTNINQKVHFSAKNEISKIDFRSKDFFFEKKNYRVKSRKLIKNRVYVKSSFCLSMIDLGILTMYSHKK